MKRILNARKVSQPIGCLVNVSSVDRSREHWKMKLIHHMQMISVNGASFKSEDSRTVQVVKDLLEGLMFPDLGDDLLYRVYRVVRVAISIHLSS